MKGRLDLQGRARRQGSRTPGQWLLQSRRSRLSSQQMGPGGGEGQPVAWGMPALRLAGCPVLLTASGGIPVGPTAEAPLSPALGAPAQSWVLGQGLPTSPAAHGPQQTAKEQRASPGLGGIRMNRRASLTPCLGQRSDSFQVTFPKCHSQWSHCWTSHSNVSPWPSLTRSTGAVPHTATRGQGGPLGPLSPQSGGGARQVPCGPLAQLLERLWQGRTAHASPFVGAPFPALTDPRCFQRLLERGLCSVRPSLHTVRFFYWWLAASWALPSSQPSPPVTPPVSHPVWND